MKCTGISISGGASIGDCGRLSQLSWLVATIQYNYTYLSKYVNLIGMLSNSRFERDDFEIS